MAYVFKHGDRPLEGITIQRAVGRGGFGEVYYALRDSGKQIALKYLRENPEIELRGIDHVMNLKSPYLIGIHDVVRNAAGEPFVVMEYISGPSLRELMIAEPGGLGVQKAAFFLKGIARGLSYLHERGIVHRDLKPGNIFYDDGYVKIGDYGLSKHMSVSKHSGQTVSVGTVHYMAPEIGSGSYSKAIDIYALGVILFEMLSGSLPFSGSSMGEILMRHLRDNPDLGSIPKPFAAVIAKALAKDPADRYQDADEMLAAVMDCEEISASVASFDATALSQVPRAVEAHDPDATLTSPHRPIVPPIPPPMDARAAGQPSDLPPRMQRKLEQLTKKLDRRAAKLEKRMGPRRDDYRPPQPAKQVVATMDLPRPAFGHWIAQSFILLIVAVAISTVLALLRGGRHTAEAATAMSFFIVGGTVGSVLVNLAFLQRFATRNAILDRLAHASMAGLFMLIGLAVALEGAHDEDLARLILAPMCAMVICNWTKRIRNGRLGKVDGGAAFWPAVVGAITICIANDDEGYLWYAAAICAAISLLTQATASMWPLAKSAPFPNNLSGKLRRIKPAQPAAHTINAEPAIPAIPTSDAGQPTDKAAETNDEPENAAPPIVVGASSPSFVGRTANAGMGFFGKLLIMTGLVIALGQGAFFDSALGQRAVRAVPDLEPLATYGVPKGYVVVLFGLGSLLLVAARRSAGGWHFVRGCLGCALLGLGGLLGMTIGASAMRELFGGADWSALQGSPLLQPLLQTAITVVVGLLLLLWPRASRHGQPETIVI